MKRAMDHLMLSMASNDCQRLNHFKCRRKGAEVFGLPESACVLKPDSTDEGEEYPLTGLTFDAMSDSQIGIFEHFGIFVEKVPANADAELVFDIYEDINSGADDLTSQQLRRAAFNGPYMSMIQGLRANKDLLAIRGSADIDMKESGSVSVSSLLDCMDGKARKKNAMPAQPVAAAAGVGIISWVFEYGSLGMIIFLLL